MAEFQRVPKSLFISYRRTNIPWALNIFQYLTHHGYDVFFDYEGIGARPYDSNPIWPALTSTALSSWREKGIQPKPSPTSSDIWTWAEENVIAIPKLFSSESRS